MAQDITSTEPIEDTAPVTTEDAGDEAAFAAPVETPEAAVATTDEPEPEEIAAPPAPAPRPAPAGATNVADALRSARAEQRKSDDADAPAPATPVAPEVELVAPEVALVDAEVAPAEIAPAATAEAVVEAGAEVVAEAASARSYDTFIESLDAPTRSLIDQHITGLKSALQAERATVKKFEAVAKTAQSLAEDKTRLETDLASRTVDVQLAQHRADFYEHAIDQGVRRKSVRLAYLAALDAGHIMDDGTVGWDELRANFSDLFGEPGRTGPTPPSRSSSAAAGAGARGDTPAAPTLNQIIRNAAGRR